jgi:hypothetical protein
VRITLKLRGRLKQGERIEKAELIGYDALEDTEKH